MPKVFTEEDCRITKKFIDDLSTAIKNREEDIDNNLDRLDAINERLEEIKELLDKTDEISELLKEIVGLKSEIARLDAEIEKKEAETLAIEADQMDPVSDRIKAIDGLIAGKEVQLTGAYEVYEIQTNLVHELGDNPDTDPSHLEEAILNLENFISYLGELEKTLETEIGELKSEREKLVSKYAELTKMIDDCWGVVHVLQERAGDLEELMNQKEDEIKELSSGKPESEKEIAIENERKELEKEKGKIKRDISDDEKGIADYIKKGNVQERLYDAHCLIYE